MADGSRYMELYRKLSRQSEGECRKKYWFSLAENLVIGLGALGYKYLEDRFGWGHEMAPFFAAASGAVGVIAAGMENRMQQLRESSKLQDLTGDEKTEAEHNASAGAYLFHAQGACIVGATACINPLFFAVAPIFYIGAREEAFQLSVLRDVTVGKTSTFRMSGGTDPYNME